MGHTAAEQLLRRRLRFAPGVRVGSLGLQVRRVMNAWGGVRGPELPPAPVPTVAEDWKGGNSTMTIVGIAQSFEAATLHNAV